ncbi:hypothetical protein ACFE04_023404 [Oxalis oulophora]
MGERWSPFGFQLLFSSLLMLLLEIRECDTLNSEGMALLEFRMKVDKDPYGAFSNWNPNDVDPCRWSSIRCVDGKVHMLNLGGFSLEGVLASELAHLTQLRSLVLNKNGFSGFIPSEIGSLHMLEFLDLRYNNLTGDIPAEIGKMRSLKHLLLCGNNFQGSIPVELQKLISLSDLQFNQNCFSEAWRGNNVESTVNIFRRRLSEVSSNLLSNSKEIPSKAAPDAPEQLAPVTLHSGSFPSTPSPVNQAPFSPVNFPSSNAPLPADTQSDEAPVPQPSPDSSSSKWVYIFSVPVVGLAFTLFAVMFIARRKGRVEPHKDAAKELRRPSQKAFIAGIAKLDREELDAACEDFSNIICKLSNYIVYKGILSDGAEIAVISTTITSYEEWSTVAETTFRRKIDALSRICHKNFVKLLGYCNEKEPFTRMLVVEYVTNGSLYEHLHADADLLDWNARVRIIMGIAYCLDHLHHDLNPPVVHSHLQSDAVLLTEDCASKIQDIDFWTDTENAPKANEGESDDSRPCLQTNVYNFGTLLLEIITGKLTYNDKDGSLPNTVMEYLEDNEKNSKLVDPILKSHKENELERICEVIKVCISNDPSQRPTMREVVSSLREVITITPEAATPRSSPLWWAELEVLSMEAV